jgi:dihydroorotase
VQTLVPLMPDHVNAGRLSLARFVDLTSAGPARLFNIVCEGRIAAGYGADSTVVDLKRSEIITNQWVASRAGGRPMTACASPAGRSALLCAANGRCGRASW